MSRQHGISFRLFAVFSSNPFLFSRKLLFYEKLLPRNAKRILFGGMQKESEMKQKETYDRAAVGMRLKARRLALGWSRSYVAEKIGVVERYYAGIERGDCGMSIETLLALTRTYDLNLDTLIYGNKIESNGMSREELLVKKIGKLSRPEKERCMQMLLLFLESCTGGLK